MFLLVFEMHSLLLCAEIEKICTYDEPIQAVDTHFGQSIVQMEWW